MEKFSFVKMGMNGKNTTQLKGKTGGTTEKRTKHYGKNLLRLFKQREFLEFLSLNGFFVTRSPVPLIITQIVLHLQQKGLNVKGLFSTNTSDSRILELREQFEAGELVDLTKQTPEVCGGILKKYLEELKEPIIPFTEETTFLECWKEKDESLRTAEVKRSIHELPIPNQETLKVLISLFHKLQHNTTTNELSSSNLASIFYSKILGNSEISQGILVDLIQRYESYFETQPEGKIRVGRSLSNSLLSRRPSTSPKKKKAEDHVVTGPFNVTKASREELLQIMEKEKERTKGGTL